MRAKAFSLIAAACLTALAGCGTPGAPQPPSLNLPKSVDDLRATRKGDVITFTWTPPSETTDGARIKGPIAVHLCAAAQTQSKDDCDAATDLKPQPLPSN